MQETGQEEIELDIDSFDPTTLYRLYRIVVKNKPDIPLSKRRKIQKTYSKQRSKQNINQCKFLLYIYYNFDK